MSKPTLDILFDSRARVKILKVLFRNQERGFTISEVTRHTQEDASTVKKEMRKLFEIGLLKKK